MEERSTSASWLFRETEYQVSSSVRDDTLEVIVEETVSMNRWTGKFEAKHIEELTRKTGNFKQFPVFTTMLESAINKSSECVTLDLLTYSDLEALRDRRNGMTTTTTFGPPVKKPSSAPCPQHSHSQGKRYLILTYSVEFDRIHYPLALSFAGQATSAQLKDTISRLATELEKYKKKNNMGKSSEALAKLQKDYDALLREKEALQEVVQSLQTQLMSVSEDNTSNKQLKMLQKVIRNLEEEVLQERNKHQRYVSKKTEEMRALTQELGELRSSERTLRSRVKNLTNELALLKKGLRSSPSTAYIRPRYSPSSSIKKTPTSSSSVGVARGKGLRQRHSNAGSLERRRQRTGSHERRLGGGGFTGGRSRTPSPRGGQLMRFDPSAYVENKRRQQKDTQQRFQRLRSPSYHGSGTHSRSSSVEKIHHNHFRSSSGSNRIGRPPVQQRSGSRRLWGSTPDSLKGTRTRSSSLGSLSCHSSRGGGSSAASSRVSSRRPSFSDIEPSPPTSIIDSGGRRISANKNQRKRMTRNHSSTPISSSNKINKNNGNLLDHSTEMSEIDARLNALQQFMKRSLEASAKLNSRKR